MKYLINNADDFGWGADISQGIIDSHIKGVLSSASTIISEIDESSVRLAKNTDTLGLGLHLNIATGEPLTSSWKKRYGSFSHPVRQSVIQPYSQELWNKHYGVYDTDLIYQEFEAQFALFEKLLGRRPDHLDTHYNTSSVKNVFEAYMQLALTHNLPVRQVVGYIGDKTDINFSSTTSELINLTNQNNLLKDKNIVATDYFSLEYINLHTNYIDAILNELEKVKDEESIEISFHPGYREDWRRKQVDILIDPKLKKTLQEHNVKVINYTDLYELKNTK